MSVRVHQQMLMLVGCAVLGACRKPAPLAPRTAGHELQKQHGATVIQQEQTSRLGLTDATNLAGAVADDAEQFARRLRRTDSTQHVEMLAGLVMSNVCDFDTLASGARQCADWREADARLSNVAARTRAGELRVQFHVPENLHEFAPADVVAYVKAGMDTLHTDARSSAAKIEILRAQNALRNEDSQAAVAVLRSALCDEAVAADTRAELYQTLAIAFNYQERYRDEADAQGQAFAIMYGQRHAAPRFVVAQACRQYVATLLNARAFDKARQLVQQLEDEGYTRSELLEAGMYDAIVRRECRPHRMRF